MKTKEINDKVFEGFIINKDLDKYAGTVFFPEKLEKVTKLVKHVPPPKFQNPNQP